MGYGAREGREQAIPGCEMCEGGEWSEETGVGVRGGKGVREACGSVEGGVSGRWEPGPDTTLSPTVQPGQPRSAPANRTRSKDRDARRRETDLRQVHDPRLSEIRRPLMMSPSSAKRRLYFHPLPATQRGSTFDRRKRGCQVASGLSKLSLASTLVLGVQAVGRLWAPYQDQDVRSVGGSAGCREIDREDWTSKTLPSRSWVRRYDGVRLASFSLSLSRCTWQSAGTTPRSASLCVSLQRTKEDAVLALASGGVPPLDTRASVPRGRPLTSGPAPRLHPTS